MTVTPYCNLFGFFFNGLLEHISLSTTAKCLMKLFKDQQKFSEAASQSIVRVEEKKKKEKMAHC